MREKLPESRNFHKPKLREYRSKLQSHQCIQRGVRGGKHELGRLECGEEEGLQSLALLRKLQARQRPPRQRVGQEGEGCWHRGVQRSSRSAVTITFPGLDNPTVSDTTQPSLQTSVYFVTNRNLFEGFVKTDIGRNNEGCCLRCFLKLSASTIQLNTLQGAKATLVREMLHKER